MAMIKSRKLWKIVEWEEYKTKLWNIFRCQVIIVINVVITIILIMIDI